MKKLFRFKNNKGFSLTELLAVIVILGILSTLAITGYSSYKEKSILKSYKTVSKNAATAAENYFIDNPSKTSIRIEDLYNQQYMEVVIDPRDKSRKCTGTVNIMNATASTSGTLSDRSYKVVLRCKNSEVCYIYPGGGTC